MSKNIPEGAILQRDKESYAIVPRTPVGLITPEQLEAITAVVRKYEVPIIKITSGQRIALVGMKEDQVEAIWNELEMGIGRAVELCVHYVQACPGTSVCQFGIQDSLGFGLELEEMYRDFDMPAKVKFGVSGCQFCCAENFVRDIGLVGKKKGWTVSFGGNAGRNARIADVIAEDITKEDALDLCRKLLEYYRDNARKKERTSKFAERVGIEEIRNAVLGE